MNESKSYMDRLATPNSSKLAQILLDLKAVDPSADSSAESADYLSETSQLVDTNSLIDHSNFRDNQSQLVDNCNCRKSKCLKLYCQCFAARELCSSSCRCTTCENRPNNDMVREAAVGAILDRNPNAFDSKYRPTSAPSITSLSSFTAVAHKNGCRCRKSLCLKKYCECFQGGVNCSSICTCLTCHNTGDSAAIADRVLESTVVGVTTHNKGVSRTSHISESSVQEALVMSGNQLQNVEGLSGGDKETTGESMPVDPSKKLSTYFEEYGGGSFVSKPPLAPLQKRRRISASQKTVHSSYGRSSSYNSSSMNVSNLTATPSNEQVNQIWLLEQLLYKELESQGLMSSPFASFVSLSSPSLAQGSEGMSLQHNLPPNEAQDNPQVVPPLAVQRGGTGIRSASPNSINIANALALLAANVQVNYTNGGCGAVVQDSMASRLLSGGNTYLPGATPQHDNPDDATLHGGAISSSLIDTKYHGGFGKGRKYSNLHQDPCYTTSTDHVSAVSLSQQYPVSRQHAHQLDEVHAGSSVVIVSKDSSQAELEYSASAASSDEEQPEGDDTIVVRTQRNAGAGQQLLLQ